MLRYYEKHFSNFSAYMHTIQCECSNRSVGSVPMEVGLVTNTYTPQDLHTSMQLESSERLYVISPVFRFVVSSMWIWVFSLVCRCTRATNNNNAHNFRYFTKFEYFNSWQKFNSFFLFFILCFSHYFLLIPLYFLYSMRILIFLFWNEIRVICFSLFNNHYGLQLFGEQIAIAKL